MGCGETNFHWPCAMFHQDWTSNSFPTLKLFVSRKLIRLFVAASGIEKHQPDRSISFLEKFLSFEPRVSYMSLCKGPGASCGKLMPFKSSSAPKSHTKDLSWHGSQLRDELYLKQPWSVIGKYHLDGRLLIEQHISISPKNIVSFRWGSWQSRWSNFKVKKKVFDHGLTGQLNVSQILGRTCFSMFLSSLRKSLVEHIISFLNPSSSAQLRLHELLLCSFTAPGVAFSPSLSLHLLVALFSIAIYALWLLLQPGLTFWTCSPNSSRVLSSPPFSSLPWPQQHRSTNAQLGHSRHSPPRQKSVIY